MTKVIIASVAVGLISGYTFLPDWFIASTEYTLVIGLCILLFFVGIDLGGDENLIKNFKKVGWRILIIPVATIVGTFAGCLVGAMFLPMDIRESMAVGAGFGWYTLAPVILTQYSAELSAISFMHNVMRELFGIILIPIVAKRIGYMETCGLPGAAAMDVCLPIVEKSTNANIAVYSFVSGVIMSISVPVMVPLIISL